MSDIDLTQFQSPPRAQGPRNTCLMFAITSAMEACCRRNGHNVLLSPQYAFWRCNKSAKTIDPWCKGGVLTFAAAEYLAQHPVCDEADSPYGSFNSSKCKEPSRTLIKKAWCRITDYLPLPDWNDPAPNVRSIELLEGALADGYEVVLAFDMGQGGNCGTMLKAQPGYPTYNQAHAVLLVG